MKKIAVTQRLGVSKYGELRAQIDIRLTNFISKCGYHPVTVPFFEGKSKLIIKRKLLKWFKDMDLSGVVLSGGEDIGKYKLRDVTEEILITYSIKKKIPIFGICRGMHVLGKYFNVKLVKVKKHVKVNHYVFSKKNKLIVNSYHNFSLTKCPKNFEIEYKSSDGHIESIESKGFKIYACMWHPERYKKFKIMDIKKFKTLFSK